MTASFFLFVGVEVVLLVVVHCKIKQNERLLQEIRMCHYDLASALWLASQERFHEAHAAARRWNDRLRALREGRAPPEPSPPPSNRTEGIRLH